MLFPLATRNPARQAADVPGLRPDRLWLWLCAGKRRLWQLQEAGGAVLLQGDDRAQGDVRRDRHRHGPDLHHRWPGHPGLQPGLGQPHLPGVGHRRRLDHGRRLHRRRLLPRHLAGGHGDPQAGRAVLRARRAVRHLPLRRDRALLRHMVEHGRLHGPADHPRVAEPARSAWWWSASC